MSAPRPTEARLAWLQGLKNGDYVRVCKNERRHVARVHSFSTDTKRIPIRLGGHWGPAYARAGASAGRHLDGSWIEPCTDEEIATHDYVEHARALFARGYRMFQGENVMREGVLPMTEDEIAFLELLLERVKAPR